MKKILLFSVIWISACLFSNAQTYSTGPTVYTCKNGSIATLQANRELNASELAAVDYALFNSNGELYYLGIQPSDIISGATSYYNCHAYAWHLTEGYTNQVWINQTNVNETANLNKYWDPNVGCFTEVSSEVVAEKIFYYSGDHSAVKSSVSGKYESKWGKMYVIRHSPTQVPYTSPANRKYFIHTPPTITGPSTLCSGSTIVFTVSNAPSVYTWSCSSNLTLTSSSGTSATFSKSGGNSGWVSVNYNGTELARKGFGIGVPLYNDISGSKSKVSTYVYEGHVNPIASYYGQIDQYQWAIAGTGWTITDLPGNIVPMQNVLITGSASSTSGVLQVRGYNACGWSGWLTVNAIGALSSYLISTYPNPVSEALNVKINLNEDAFAKTKVSGDKNQTFEIRLYDYKGVMVRQNMTAREGVTSFDVSGLPDGIYYLHVISDSDKTPDVHKVIIRK
jgi:hypothetical protein